MAESDEQDWITPAEALRRAEAAYSSKAVGADHIRTLLRDGIVTAGSDTSILREDHEKERRYSNTEIPANQWPISPWYGNEEFWLTAQIELVEGRYKRWSYHQVRIDGAGLARQLPAHPMETGVASLPEKSDVIRLGQVLCRGGPPVSQAALEAWFLAYKVAFSGAEETEANAMESARGCFPGKSFSRDAVRGLRGGQKRGPKPKTAK